MTVGAIPASGVARFRFRLAISMMVVVTLVTTTALFFTQRNLAANVEAEQLRRFESNLALLHTAQEVRHAVLLERCRTLVRRPRIVAAFEDDALDLLYPSAREELRNLMDQDPSIEGSSHGLHAIFYRFIDLNGEIIHPAKTDEVGWLHEDDQAALNVRRSINGLQLGYRFRTLPDGARSLMEVMITPIISSETEQVLASIAIGFKPTHLENANRGDNVQEIIWTPGATQGNKLLPSLETAISAVVFPGKSDDRESRFTWNFGEREFRVFVKQLNPGSILPPAFEVVLFPLDELQARKKTLTLKFAFAGIGLIFAGLVSSHFVAKSLAQPVEKLAVDSEENRKGRAEALTALSQTSEELERTSRFSSDASHQLKTPVTVMRAGLDELLARENLPEDIREELQNLVHQTFRLSSIVDDLLLLSRMDAGRLKIQRSRIDLVSIIESALDDLSVLSDDLRLNVSVDLPDIIPVDGEKHFLGIVFQNLLENARKYNRFDGRILVHAWVDDSWVRVSISNSGLSIPPALHEAIFERFHRGETGETIPGHGLGLNLARDLVRLHGGELRLVRSVDNWTEFEVTLPAVVKAV